MIRHRSTLMLLLSLLILAVGCPDEETDPAPPDAGGEDTVMPDDGDGPGDEDTGGPDPDTGDPDTGEPMPNPEQQTILGVEETESWTLAGLGAPAYVVRTEANIPHVYAQDREDLGRVLGFTLARDRFFVMDLQRRLGLGTITELLGEAGLETDLEARQTGITFVADRLHEHMGAEMRAYLQAFAEGVNAYIDAVRAGDLPPPSELTFASELLDAESPADLMEDFDVRGAAAMAAVVMYETNYETGDVGRTGSLQKLDTLFEGATQEDLRRDGFIADIYNDVRPIFPGSGSTSGFGLTGAASKPGPADMSGARHVPVPQRMLERLSERLDRFQVKIQRNFAAGFGSNAWAVAGSATPDGGAVVAGDGHLQLSVPSLMYQVAMDTRVFGDGDTHQIGLFLTPLPVTGAGTNGKVAWSMVNPVLDITDWYREELQLDGDGAPSATKFQGEWKPLNAVEESFVIADIPILGSAGRTDSWTRYTTFDGRWLLEIEGQEVDSPDEAGDGEAVVNLQGTLVIPRDMDDDGVIHAISFDHGAFDATRWPEALAELGFTNDVEEYRQATRMLVGGGLFMAAGDQAGSILYSSYQAVPCRGYLEKQDGAFTAGSHPAYLLDGTTYGGFTMPTNEDGTADETAGATDPYQCVVPFDDMPQAIDPPEQYVATANNDPATITDDGDHTNDQWYIGGPWSSVRASTIMRSLETTVEDGAASVEAMSELQGNNSSRLGEEFAPLLSETIQKAFTLSTSEEQLAPHEQRLADLLTAHQDRFFAVSSRLTNWAAREFDADSGVETFYETPDDAERQNAVATMIFNAWFPRFLAHVWDDEPLGGAFPYSGSRQKVAALKRFLANRGPTNAAGHASWNPATGEAVFFDKLGTEAVERSDELMLVALVEALDWLESEPTEPGRGGFGTDDMTQWLWGLRHQARFESLLGSFLGDDPTFGPIAELFSITTTVLPLAEDLPAGDPRADLKWFSRGGDQWGVDAANPGFSGTSFTYGSGPVMRMVISLTPDHVGGVNVVPGGQSGLNDSPFFADQARLWLANEALPLRFDPASVAEGATGRETFLPPEEPEEPEEPENPEE